MAVRAGAGRLLAQGTGGTRELPYDALLLGTGRKANVEHLDLGAAGVHVARDGVEVDEYLCTSNPNTYAIGDATFPQKFTYAANATARLCIANALDGAHRPARELVIPHCTYTDPEVAEVGLTLNQHQNPASLAGATLSGTAGAASFTRVTTSVSARNGLGQRYLSSPAANSKFRQTAPGLLASEGSSPLRSTVCRHVHQHHAVSAVGRSRLARDRLLPGARRLIGASGARTDHLLIPGGSEAVTARRLVMSGQRRPPGDPANPGPAVTRS